MPAPSAVSVVDRVDEADRTVGVVERRRVFAEHANFRVVHILLFDSQGRLLLQRLSERRERNPGLWGSSVAGYLHAGEKYWEAASRRLGEELGLKVELAKLGNTVMLDQGCRKFIEVFVAHSADPVIREPDHISEIQFVEVSELFDRVRENPEAFTETFRHVFDFFRAVSRISKLA